MLFEKGFFYQPRLTIVLSSSGNSSRSICNYLGLSRCMWICVALLVKAMTPPLHHLVFCFRWSGLLPFQHVLGYFKSFSEFYTCDDLRMSTALARLRLSNVVLPDDIEEAIRLMQTSKDSLRPEMLHQEMSVILHVLSVVFLFFTEDLCFQPTISNGSSVCGSKRAQFICGWRRDRFADSCGSVSWHFLVFSIICSKIVFTAVPAKVSAKKHFAMLLRFISQTVWLWWIRNRESVLLWTNLSSTSIPSLTEPFVFYNSLIQQPLFPLMPDLVLFVNTRNVTLSHFA